MGYLVKTNLINLEKKTFSINYAFEEEVYGGGGFSL